MRHLLVNAVLGFTVAMFTALPAQAEMSNGGIKIGVLTDATGVYSEITGKGAITAAKMAVADFTAAHPEIDVELISANHQNKPDVAMSIARQWFDVEGADVLAELTTSSIALAAQNLAESKDKLILISGAGSSDITGASCSKHGIHWTYDTYALANGTARAVVAEGGKKWFLVTVDYAFGRALANDVKETVTQMGGEVVGEVTHPLGTTDFASYLIQAKNSGAGVIGLANAGGDLINAIKQASAFGITQGDQKLAALLMYISDVHALGLETARGLYLTTGFYWDINEATRRWSERFYERTGKMPTMAQAGVYSSLMHYLQAAAAAGTDDAMAVRRKMGEMPVDGFFASDGKVRADGRMMHDMYLVQVKSPDESQRPWDYYEVIRTIPGKEAFKALSDGGCPPKNRVQ